MSKNGPFAKVGHQLGQSRKYFFSPKDGASRSVWGNQIANEFRTYHIYPVTTLVRGGAEPGDGGNATVGREKKRRFGIDHTYISVEFPTQRRRLYL